MTKLVEDNNPTEALIEAVSYHWGMTVWDYRWIYVDLPKNQREFKIPCKLCVHEHVFRPSDTECGPSKLEDIGIINMSRSFVNDVPVLIGVCKKCKVIYWGG